MHSFHPFSIGNYLFRLELTGEVAKYPEVMGNLPMGYATKQGLLWQFSMDLD